MSPNLVAFPTAYPAQVRFQPLSPQADPPGQMQVFQFVCGTCNKPIFESQARIARSSEPVIMRGVKYSFRSGGMIVAHHQARKTESKERNGEINAASG
jgi:hypothetical protein